MTHDKAGKAAVTIHSDDPADRRDAAPVDEACKAVASMKGWKSAVNVYVVTGQRLARKDRQALLQHHFIPTGWVARVDSHVHLTKNSVETEQGWKPDAAGCASCGS